MWVQPQHASGDPPQGYVQPAVDIIASTLMLVGALIMQEAAGSAMTLARSMSSKIEAKASASETTITSSRSSWATAKVRSDTHGAPRVLAIEVISISSLAQAVGFLTGEIEIEPRPSRLDDLFRELSSYESDFSDVRGQEMAKRALSVSAAGGHNLLMVGPPGSGKTMLAKRVPSILPDLTPGESIETTRIYSAVGRLKPGQPLLATRPYRAPHHTISNAGLVGGGSIPGPGEISLAHNGVLFLDELPEFNRPTLEVLRQPLEDGTVQLAVDHHTSDPLVEVEDMTKVQTEGRLLLRIGKGIEPEDAIPVIRMVNERGIKTYSFFMINQPDETRADLEATISLVRRLASCRLNHIQLNTGFPYPATSWWEYCDARGLTGDIDFYADSHRYNHWEVPAVNMTEETDRYVIEVKRRIERMELLRGIRVQLRFAARMLRRHPGRFWRKLIRNSRLLPSGRRGVQLPVAGAGGADHE